MPAKTATRLFKNSCLQELLFSGIASEACFVTAYQKSQSSLPRLLMLKPKAYETEWLKPSISYIQIVFNQTPASMLLLLNETKDNKIFIRISGAVNKGDYDRILPIMEERIEKFGEISVYIEIIQSMDFSLNALWQELKFDVKNARNFRKIGIVGDSKWLDALAITASPFTSAKIKKFGHEQRQEAMNWVRADI